MKKGKQIMKERERENNEVLKLKGNNIYLFKNEITIK